MILFLVDQFFQCKITSGLITNQIFGRLCQPDGLVSGEGLGQADGQVVLQREEVVVVEHDRRDVHLKSYI
jgi:hypothetical protein